MVEVNDDENEVLVLKISGTLTAQELDELVPLFDSYVTRSHNPCLLMILDNFNYWQDAAAIWEELKLDIKYIGYFSRIAIVSKKKWLKWGSRLLNPITKTELKFFPHACNEVAKKWIESNPK